MGWAARLFWRRPQPDPPPPPPPTPASALLTPQGQFCRAPASPSAPLPTPHPPGYLLGQQGQRVPRLRGRRGGRLQKVVFGVGAGHGTVRATAVWLPPRDYHHPSGSGQWARLRAGGRRRPRALAPSSARHDAARPTGGPGGGVGGGWRAQRARAGGRPLPQRQRAHGPPSGPQGHRPDPAASRYWPRLLLLRP